MQLLLLSLCVITQIVQGDVYMHNPRGSNDRGCETNDNRNNGNRLFDSQNNAKGGYACGNAYPFACYLLPVEADRDTCNNLNGNSPDDLTTLQTPLMDNGGLIVANNAKINNVEVATRTDRMFFIEGSRLTVEWTNQHGCGDNPKLHCDIIIQYACEDTLTDDCGLPGQGKTCGPRDGLPITNSDANRGAATYQNILGGTTTINRRNRDRDATETIPVSTTNNVQSDPRFGRHETLEYFLTCARRERNKGLFTADQKINGKNAQFTRQNPNGNRNGLECAEESEYYPYWHPSPWKDVAILTDQIDRCAELQAESQNVKEKNLCECPTCIAQNQLVPNNELGCQAAGGNWVIIPPFNIDAPFCGKAPTTRENHNGNPVGDGAVVASAFNWTIPSVVSGDTCVLRIRYNISTGDDISAADPRDVTVFGTNSQNGAQSPLKDRQNSEALSYVKFAETTAKVGLEMNTNQFGRTFQDRSLSFSIKPRPTSGPCATSGKIYNLNVRGKRGNIVQVYPAVEYDFVPNDLSVEESDCVHVQWTGSDYNPARNDNDAFGGPNDPKDMNNGRADRSNLVEMAAASNNIPVASLESDMTLFTASLTEKLRLVFLDQNVNDPAQCLDIAEIQALSKQAQKTNDDQFRDNGNNFLDQDEDRDRFFKNCAKLSGQRTPYFNGGLLQAGTLGVHFFLSTRNTCFSNRDQRGILRVFADGTIPDDAGNPGAADAASVTDPVPIVAGVGGGIAAMLGIAGLVAYRRRSRSGSNDGSGSGGGGFNFKEKAADTFNTFRSSFANFGGFGGGAHFQGFGGGGGNSPPTSPMGGNNGGGGGFFRQSMAQTQLWASNMRSAVFGGGGASQGGMGGYGAGMSANQGAMAMGGGAMVMGGAMAAAPPRTQQSTQSMASAHSMAGGGGGGFGMQQRAMPSMASTQSNGMQRAMPSMPIQRATAMYDHVASEAGELSFRKGDVINVMRRDASGWWEGESNGQRGIFPANYVRVQSAGWT